MDQTLDELEGMARDASLDEDTRIEVLQELSDRVEAQPELAPRITELLRELLARTGAESAEEETFTASLIETALDIHAVELLPEIEQAFAEDRVDLQIIDLAMVYDKFDLPAPPQPARRTDGLYLLLRCTACDRVREHFTRFVIIDENSLDDDSQTGHRPFIIDHEFVCPKCGAVEQYALSPLEWIRLMQMDEAQILAMLKNEAPDKPLRPHPRVFYMRGEAFGRPMHPLDIVAEYRGRIALDPKNADLHSGLGNSLRFIGRYEQALVCYRTAVALDPLDTTYLYEAATAEHDFGDPQAARELYERCLAAGRIEGKGIQITLPEAVRASMQGLQALERGERSPWDYRLINASGVRLLPPPRAAIPGGAQGKKDKRRRRH